MAKDLFSGAIIALGVAVVLAGLSTYQAADATRTAVWMLLALVASGIRIRLPKLPAQPVSLSFIFVLVAIVELTSGEALILATATTAIQIAIDRNQLRRGAVAALFQMASAAIAAAICWEVYYSPLLTEHGLNTFQRLVITSSMLYGGNTFPLAAMTALSEGRSLARTWREISFWTFPYYLVGALVATGIHASWSLFGDVSLAVLVPVSFLFYFASHFYMGRLSRRTSELEQMSALHQRTIESLAIAIETKDETAEGHLERMQLYALDMAKELNLPPNQVDAIRAAAILHDVGKLAVPEHVLNKAGKLTREEFEKVKIHPDVGAQIVERVNFPYPVAPIVRHHHERWDGTGYPAGLSGESIPIGARIIAIVDCFDVLTINRPYRAAMSTEEALKVIVAESGVGFDPQLVKLLSSRYKLLEAQLKAEHQRHTADKASSAASRPRYFDSIVAARQEEQVILEIVKQMSDSLVLDEAIAALVKNLHRLIAFDSAALYVSADGVLTTRYADGKFTAYLHSQQIPFGEGVVGFAAKTQKPVLNGSPTEEFGFPSHGPGSQSLGSALALPLQGRNGLAGVFMLCRHEQEAFTKDHLRVVQSVTATLGSVVENSLRYEQATSSASTDYLTGLPNARALSQQLETEIVRSERQGSSLVVLVTDLDGFKAVNDNFGHLEGNRVLCAVAKVLRQSCREYDYVGRLGGDEFVMILPGLGEKDVRRRIAALDEAVSRAAREICPEAVIGLSAGTARCWEDGATAPALLAAADERMYEAKAMRKARASAGSVGFDFDFARSAF